MFEDVVDRPLVVGVCAVLAGEDSSVVVDEEVGGQAEVAFAASSGAAQSSGPNGLGDAAQRGPGGAEAAEGSDRFPDAELLVEG